MTAYDEISYSEDQRERKFELHPKGAVQAVCVDVIDLGKVANPFKTNEDGTPEMVHKIRIVWETAKKKANGTPFTISKSYKLSLYSGNNGGKASGLWTDLNSWLGSSWDGKFRSGMIVGLPCALYIRHEAQKNDPTKVYAKVVSVDAEEGEGLTASGQYKRFVPKEQQHEETAAEAVGF